MRSWGLLLALLAAGCWPTVQHQGHGAQDASPATDGGTPTGPQDLLPGPAVEGGSITTPPACAPAVSDLRITSGPGVFDFAWLWDTDHYIVVFSESGALRVLRLGTGGTPAAPPQLLDSTSQPAMHATLTRLDSGVLVAWETGAPGAASHAIRMRMLDLAGNPLAPAVGVATSTAREARPVLARGPAGAVLGWMDLYEGRDTSRVAKVSPALALDTPRRLGDSSSCWPSVAGDGITTSALWTDAKAGVYGVRIARFDEHMNVMMESALHQTMEDIRLSRIIRTTFGYLAAWENGKNEIHMALVATSGGKIAEDLVEEPKTGDAVWPNMAWSGSAAGIVYEQRRGPATQVYLTVRDSTGARVGGGADQQVSHTTAGSRAGFADVQWNGQQFGVTWIDTRGGAPQLYFSNLACK